LAFFEKKKCIFSIAPMGNLKMSRECFLAEKHSPDAGRGRTGRCVCASGVQSVPGSARVRHRTPGTRRGLDPVASSAACPLLVSLTESTGHSRCVRWYASGALRICSALWVRDRMLWVRLVTPRVFRPLGAPNASGANLTASVLCR